MSKKQCIISELIQKILANAKQNRRNARKAKNNSNLNQNVLFSDEESDKDFSGDSDSDGYVPGNNMDESSESSNYSINSEP